MIGEQTAEQMEYELKMAGWKQLTVTDWESPSGLRYRGLHQCWKMMKAHPELQAIRVSLR